MRLPVKPWRFLLRLLVLFFLTFILWKPVAPAYTELLIRTARVGVWLTEWPGEPPWNHRTALLRKDVKETPGIFYYNPIFSALQPPLAPQGIPADWVMANLVLLVPLMLATPAPTWRARFARLLVALAVALLLQVVGMIVLIKSFYASMFKGYWSPAARTIYQFLDAFFQSFDTQLFPVAIWAGIHFRQLLGTAAGEGEETEEQPRSARRRQKQRRA